MGNAEASNAIKEMLDTKGYGALQTLAFDTYVDLVEALEGVLFGPTTIGEQKLAIDHAHRLLGRIEADAKGESSDGD